MTEEQRQDFVGGPAEEDRDPDPEAAHVQREDLRQPYPHVVAVIGGIIALRNMDRLDRRKTSPWVSRPPRSATV
ncbi:hypothetical protein ACVH9Z_23925 [Rhodococcus opacus]